MDQPIRLDNPIQSDARCELIITDPAYVAVPSDLHLILFSKSTRLMTTDLKAVNHVLFNSYDYPKPVLVRQIIRGLFGSGAFCCKLGGIS